MNRREASTLHFQRLLYPSLGEWLLTYSRIGFRRLYLKKKAIQSLTLKRVQFNSGGSRFET